jgi:hypothetical protein
VELYFPVKGYESTVFWHDGPERQEGQEFQVKGGWLINDGKRFSYLTWTTIWFVTARSRQGWSVQLLTANIGSELKTNIPGGMKNPYYFDAFRNDEIKDDIPADREAHHSPEELVTVFSHDRAF